jgi:fructokinase
MRIGIDFGGTKIEAIALDSDGAELRRKRIPTPRGDYAGSVKAVTELVAGLEADLGRRGSVGIGIPGCISPATGLVKNANATWLIGRDLRGDLERSLARPLRVENDANCLAVSEAVDGAAASARLVFAVIIGTGAGGGIAIERQAWAGPNSVAGEWAHNPLPWPNSGENSGPACYCGKHGCLETYISGPGLCRDYAEESGRRLTSEAIIAAAEAGETEALMAYKRYADRLARGLAITINVLDPQVIVIGGGLSNIARLYEDLPGLVEGYVFSDTFSTPIRPAKHGDSSGVRGAAWLWNE